ncbi:hypothetical protein ACU8KH_05834 [Lachancea thermotolerans]
MRNGAGNEVREQTTKNRPRRLDFHDSEKLTDDTFKKALPPNCRNWPTRVQRFNCFEHLLNTNSEFILGNSTLLDHLLDDLSPLTLASHQIWTDRVSTQLKVIRRTTNSIMLRQVFIFKVYKGAESSSINGLLIL